MVNRVWIVLDFNEQRQEWDAGFRVIQAHGALFKGPSVKTVLHMMFYARIAILNVFMR